MVYAKVVSVVETSKVLGAVVLSEAEAQLQKDRDACQRVQHGVIHYVEELHTSKGAWMQKGSARSLGS